MRYRVDLRMIGMLLLLLASGRLAAAEEYWNFIPARTDLAVLVRTEALFQNAALQKLTESGDLKRLRKELALVPWGKPDTILTVFGGRKSYAMLVESPCAIDELETRLRTAYRKASEWRIERDSRQGFPLLRMRLIRPGRRERTYELVWLAPRTVLMAGDRNTIPWELLDRSYAPEVGARLRLASDADVLYGVSPAPSRLPYDLLGVFRRLTDLEFALGAPAAAREVALRVDAAARDAASAEAVRSQIESAGRLLLVALLGGRPELFEQVNAAWRCRTDGSRVRVEMRLAEPLIRELRRYYESDPTILRQAVDRNLQTGR